MEAVSFRRIPPPPVRPGEGLLVRSENSALLRRLHPAWGPCLDFVYSDPPFFSGTTRRASGGGEGSFPDRWPGGLDAYLAWLRERFVLLRDLLRDTGTFLVHLDHRAVHYVRVELDRIFGRDHFLNEVIWHYTGGGRSRSYFSRKHDNLLWYRKGKTWTFRIDAVRVPYRPTSGYARSGIVSARGKRYLPHPDGTPADDVWDIPIVNPLAGERTGYPTQKPVALLDRIVRGCTAPGDRVGDFFGGSGTTAVAACRLGRRWILCDESAAAFATAARRLRSMSLGRLVREPGGGTGNSVLRFLPWDANRRAGVPGRRVARPVPDPSRPPSEAG
ncbi:MAG: site-specific DNA-methyltransferase [Acidobacteria bacterium]|nr:site-specific DNA-methyltransferase [Acidobacteriota bacterium]